MITICQLVHANRLVHDQSDSVFGWQTKDVNQKIEQRLSSNELNDFASLNSSDEIELEFLNSPSSQWRPAFD